MYVCHNYVHVHGHTLVSCTHAHWLVNINITQSESGKLNTYTCMRSWIIIKALKFENKYRSLTRTALQNDVPDTISFGTHIKNVCRHKVKINLLQTAIIHSYQRIKYKQIFYLSNLPFTWWSMYVTCACIYMKDDRKASSLGTSYPKNRIRYISRANLLHCKRNVRQWIGLPVNLSI